MEPARCQVRVEGGAMDEQIDSKQGPSEQLPRSEEEWRRRLSPDQFEVLRNKGTERAFTGKYAFTKDRGVYRCAACGAELFRSDAKYDSGTGWPSFFEPIAELRHAPNRGHVRPVRRPPWPFVRQRSPADRRALLHELDLSESRGR
jgi:hypothetical protein